MRVQTPVSAMECLGKLTSIARDMYLFLGEFKANFNNSHQHISQDCVPTILCDVVKHFTQTVYTRQLMVVTVSGDFMAI